MKFCKLADIVDWQDPEFQSIADSLLLGDAHHRKAWEFIQVYRGLKTLGLLNGNSKALGLGVGHECLIYAFANTCQQVVATDLYESQRWSTAAMGVSQVYDQNLFPYQRDRLVVQRMDMTQIEYPNESFDFVWSCCAIEHVNNFQDLHQVYREIHRVLKPGGIAALTTEFNTTDRPSYEPNMLFTDRAWMETWLTGVDPLVQGFELIDAPDYSVSDREENQPLSRKSLTGPIQVCRNDIVLNSIAFFLRKTGTFDQPYQPNWVPEFWRQYLAACDAYRLEDFAQAEAILKALIQTTEWEPRLKVRAFVRLAMALSAQNKLEELRQICLTILSDCQVFRDENQFGILASHCMKVGLWDEAKFLYEMIEKLPGSDLELVLNSCLGQARCYKQQQNWEKVLEVVGKAEQELIAGSPIEATYKPKIYYWTGLAYEKMEQLSSAIRFYKLATEISAAGSEDQLNCYRRMTGCLQTQVKRLKQRVNELESKNPTTPGSRLGQLRSKFSAAKDFFKRRASSPPLG